MQALPETKRLFLREWTMQDLDAWAAILSDAEVMRYYSKPFDRQKVQDWIAWNLENYRTDGFGLWAVHLRATGELLGDCGITMQQIHGQRLPEIGFHMKKSVWGQGYATEAAKACLAWGMQQTDFQRSIATRRARICHHKNEIFRKSTKRPAIINITARDYFIWECSRRIFRHSIVIKRARTCPHGELRRNWE